VPEYETATSDREVLEKGGYSPPERVYDMSSLPNAPEGPAPGAAPTSSGSTTDNRQSAGSGRSSEDGPAG
jgi:hypothetical protein